MDHPWIFQKSCMISRWTGDGWCLISGGSVDDNQLIHRCKPTTAMKNLTRKVLKGAGWRKRAPSWSAFFQVLVWAPAADASLVWVCLLLTSSLHTFSMARAGASSTLQFASQSPWFEFLAFSNPLDGFVGLELVSLCGDCAVWTFWVVASFLCCWAGSSSCLFNPGTVEVRSWLTSLFPRFAYHVVLDSGSPPAVTKKYDLRSTSKGSTQRVPRALSNF